MNTEVLVALVMTPLFVLAFASVGGRLLRFAEVTGTSNSLKTVPIAVAIGFCVYSYLGHLLLLFPPLSPTIILAVIIAGIFAGYAYLVTLWADIKRSVSSFKGMRVSLPLIVFAGMTTGMFILLVSNALSPTRDTDALRGYMFTAKWISSHGLGYIPYNPRYSTFPLGTEVVFSYSFAFGTQFIAKYLDWFIAIFLVAGVYEFANRYAGRLYSFVAAAGFLFATRELLDSIGSGTINSASAFTMLMGWSLLFLSGNSSNLKALALSAFLVGASCNQKYTNWLIALTFPWGVMLIGKWRRWSIIAAVVATLVIGTCVLPHMVRDYAQTGNPVAPFAYRFIPTSNVYISQGETSLERGFVPSSVGLAAILELPQRIFFDAGSNGLGPFPWLLLLGLPAYGWIARKPRELQLIFLLATVQLTAWLVVAPPNQRLNTRYVIPIIGLFMVIAALGIEACALRVRRVKWVVLTVFAAAFFVQGIWHIRDAVKHWKFIAGLETEEEWQAEFAFRGYSGFRKIADSLGPDKRLMLWTSYLFNVPTEKLPFVSTEKDFYDLFILPDSEKVAFLKQKNFRYVFVAVINDKVPGWCKDLPRLDFHYRYSDGVGYNLYEIAPAANERDQANSDLVRR